MMISTFTAGGALHSTTRFRGSTVSPSEGVMVGAGREVVRQGRVARELLVLHGSVVQAILAGREKGQHFLRRRLRAFEPQLRQAQPGQPAGGLELDDVATGRYRRTRTRFQPSSVSRNS